METHAPVRRCVTILLPPGAALGDGGVQLLLRYAQRHCGAAPWAGGAAVEEYRGGCGTLLIARPAVTAALAPYALPFIHKYFKD